MGLYKIYYYCRKIEEKVSSDTISKRIRKNEITYRSNILHHGLQIFKFQKQRCFHQKVFKKIQNTSDKSSSIIKRNY